MPIPSKHATGMTKLSSFFAPRAANASKPIVISDDEDEQPPSKRRSTKRTSTDAATTSPSTDDEPTTKKLRRTVSSAMLQLISPSKHAPAVMSPLTATRSKTVSSNDLQSKAVKSHGGSPASAIRASSNSTTFRSKALKMTDTASADAQMSRTSGVALSSMTFISKSDMSANTSSSVEVQSKAIKSRSDVNTATALDSLKSKDIDQGDEGDSPEAGIPDNWTAQQKEAHRIAIAASKKYLSAFEEPKRHLKSRFTTIKDEVRRARPPGAEFTQWTKGACKAAMLSLPLARHRAAVYAWEFMASICGYKGPPSRVGEAPTQELVAILRDMECVPAFFCNDNKLRSYRGPLCELKDNSSNPIWSYSLWHADSKCTACEGYHNTVNVRLSVIILLGIEYATPEEMGKYTTDGFELSHFCGVPCCLIHSRPESRKVNNERDEHCLSLLNSKPCNHDATAAGACIPDYKKSFGSAAGFMDRVETLRDELKAFYDQKSIVCE